MIGQTIKKYREQKGWTQEELAFRMGYKSKSTINKIENNINDVSQSTIVKLSQVFGCTPTDLLGEIQYTTTLPMPDDDKTYVLVDKDRQELVQMVCQTTPQSAELLYNMLKALDGRDGG